MSSLFEALANTKEISAEYAEPIQVGDPIMVVSKLTKASQAVTTGLTREITKTMIISPDGKFLFVNWSYSPYYATFSIENGQITAIPNFLGTFSAASDNWIFSPDGKWLAVSISTGTNIYLINGTNYTLQTGLSMTSATMPAMQFSPDSQYFVRCFSAVPRVDMFRIQNNQFTAFPLAPTEFTDTSSLTSVIFSPITNLVFFSSIYSNKDTRLCRIEANGLTTVATFTDFITSSALFTPDGKFLIRMRTNGTPIGRLYVYDEILDNYVDAGTLASSITATQSTRIFSIWEDEAFIHYNTSHYAIYNHVDQRFTSTSEINDLYNANVYLQQIQSTPYFLAIGGSAPYIGLVKYIGGRLVNITNVEPWASAGHTYAKGALTPDQKDLYISIASSPWIAHYELSTKVYKAGYYRPEGLGYALEDGQAGETHPIILTWF